MLILDCIVLTTCYLKAGLGNACAGQVRETGCPRLDDTKPIIAVENFGKVVPMGSARFVLLHFSTCLMLAWATEKLSRKKNEPTNHPVSGYFNLLDGIVETRDLKYWAVFLPKPRDGTGLCRTQ